MGKGDNLGLTLIEMLYRHHPQMLWRWFELPKPRAVGDLRCGRASTSLDYHLLLHASRNVHGVRGERDPDQIQPANARQSYQHRGVDNDYHGNDSRVLRSASNSSWS